MINHPAKKYLIGVFLTLCNIWLLGVDLAAQSCLDDYAQRDSVIFEIPLGECEVSEDQILAMIGLAGCEDATLTTSAVGLNNTRIVDLIDESTDAIIDIFEVTVRAESDFVPSLIAYDIAPADCFADKDFLLDQLNVDTSSSVRANIHFISGTSRVTDFSIGDTTYIDRVVCGDGYTYARDIRVFFGLEHTFPYRYTINHELDFTTQKVSLEEILFDHDYFNYYCDFDRFSVEHDGPFGYGTFRAGDLFIDNALIAENLQIRVLPASACPATLNNFVLPDGQCYINKSDILTEIGFDPSVDDYSRVELVLGDGESLEDESFTIRSVLVDGYPVCSNDIPVSYMRMDIMEADNFACNDMLNISLDTMCEVHLNSDVLLEGGPFCYLNFIVTAKDETDKIIAQGHNIVLESAGSYTVSITDPRTDVTCWSIVNIEDKHIYNVTCPPDTVQCYYDLSPAIDILEGPPVPYVGIASTFELIASREYNIINADACGIKYATYEDVEVDACVDDYKMILDRQWRFEDLAGNVDTCTQRLYVVKVELDSVDRFETFHTDCISDFVIFDNAGHPSPEETGYPTVNGGAYPANVCGTLKMTYSDNTFELCGLSQKIVREWLIIDWCTDRVERFNQTILIEDRRAPMIIDTVADMTLNSHPFICGVEDVQLPLPVYSDCGSETVDLRISYETTSVSGRKEIIDLGNSSVIPEILMDGIEGEFDVFYELTDECGNVAYDTMTIYVADNQPPVAVCDQNTAISIAGNGQAQVKALTFDDLSVDNCGIEKYEVRKVTGECYVSEEFSEVALFCCEEVGQVLQVEFRVTDFAGNYNTCMVYVEIFDKFKPLIYCPEDITIDCAQDYTDLDVTGEATAIDNCVIDSLYYVDDIAINDCGHGSITRTWTAIDRGGEVVTCDQQITIMSTTPFSMTAERYPQDTIVEGCLTTVEPSFTGEPNLVGSACSDVVATYEDTYFYDVSGACFKIIRKWIVIDWCQYSTANPTEGFWTQPQSIKVQNSAAPSFIGLPADTTICSFGVDCSDQIALTAMAEDDCTPVEDLDWFYEVYHADDTEQSIRTGTGQNVNINLEVGEYLVRFTVSDGCSNYNRQTINLTVQDCVAPNAVCPTVEGLAVLNSAGVGIVRLSDFDFAATDNCTANDELIYSFDADSLVTTMNFDCSDILDGISGSTVVPVYVSDAAGNVNSCDVVIQIFDNSSDVCPDVLPEEPEEPDTMMAAGAIYTEELVTVDGVEVLITGPNGQKKSFTTDTDGEFSFEHLQIADDYELSFQRGGAADDGMTTLDMIYIRRHILGLGVLDSPYKIIAADIDNNQRVTGGDLVKMRRVILGMDSDFGDSQKSWRFIRANHKVDNQWSPWPYPETITLEDVDRDQTELDMMAIKIGDVNGSNEVNSRFKANGRSAVTFSVMDQQLSTSAVTEVPVYADDLQIWGAQFSIAWDREVEVLGLTAGQIALDAEDYHINAEGRWLTMSHAGVAPFETTEEQPLFYIMVRSDAGQYISESILLGTDRLDALAVVNDLEEQDIVFDWQRVEAPEVESDVLSLSEVSPNPVSDRAALSLYIPADQAVELEITDASGRSLWSDTQYFTKGKHKININTNHLHTSQGLLLFHLYTESDHLVRKMMRVE